MSLPEGHRTITRHAVSELVACDNALFQGLARANLPRMVVLRDVHDVFNAGHWRSSAQAHHFMRRFDDQSEWEAYQESVRWIFINTRAAVLRLERRLQHLGKPMRTNIGKCGVPPVAIRNSLMLYSSFDGPWRSFGNALHALQDSFSRGHVHRMPATPSRRPGTITRILRYAGNEADDHKEHDRAWKTDRGQWSERGRFAVEASKALIKMAARSAWDVSQGKPAWEHRFEHFRSKWIAADPTLRSR